MQYNLGYLLYTPLQVPLVNKTPIWSPATRSQRRLRKRAVAFFDIGAGSKAALHQTEGVSG